MSAFRAGGRAADSVRDTGPGIAAEGHERVLGRFVRLEAARETSGNGLGLSLVDAIARQHGAVLQLESNKPGLRATLWLSRLPADKTRQPSG